MTDKLVKDVLSAAADLKLVAKGLHIPLDTSNFERAVKALVAGVDAAKAEFEKGLKEASKPAEKPAEAPKADTVK